MTPAAAHEFWIEAEDYVVPADGRIVADLKVGQEFKGDVIGFYPTRFRRFEIVTDGQSVPVSSRLGDKPAVNQPAAGPGLNIIVHVTSDGVVDYDDLAGFARFVEKEGLFGGLEAHRARGLPEADFKESFFRSVKALVQVGPDDASADRAIGLPVEIVLDGTPYAEPAPASISGQALYEGAPMAGAKLLTFTRPANDNTGEAQTGSILLDDDGRFTLPLAPGRRYLLNVVRLREPSEAIAATGAVWESVWGSTTFETR